jgi:hypothetical protein
MMQEIVASQIDPRLRTVSDCLQDAAALWIENYIEYCSDGLSGRSLRLFQLERLQRNREAQQSYLDKWDEELIYAKQHDPEQLHHLLSQIKQEHQETNGHPHAYAAELVTRIDRLTEIFPKVPSD